MPSSEVMHKFKHGKLKSGGSGKTVKKRKQAIAIMMSEKRNEKAHGGKYKEANGPQPQKGGGFPKGKKKRASHKSA